MSYYDKYLKYKEKYVKSNTRKQTGGALNLREVNLLEYLKKEQKRMTHLKDSVAANSDDVLNRIKIECKLSKYLIVLNKEIEPLQIAFEKDKEEEARKLAKASKIT